MGTRGRVWATYVDDAGSLWAVQVDADSAADAARDWDVTAAAELEPLPRGWRPRRVIGVDAEGFEHSCRVGTVFADLWTGVATTFDVEGSDGLIHTCTRLGTRQERRRRPAGAL